MRQRTAAASAAKARIRDAAQARILDAAAEVFARKGQAAATIAEIAERAAMPSATVHYYFGSKAALYEAVLAQVLDLWSRELAHLEATAPPAAALGAYIRAKMRVSFAHPAASRIVANEVLQGGERIQAFLKDAFMPLFAQKRDLVAAWRRDGAIRPIDANHLFYMIWASTEFYANFSAEILTLSGEAALTQEAFSRAADSVVDLILNGMLPRRDGLERGATSNAALPKG